MIDDIGHNEIGHPCFTGPGITYPRSPLPAKGIILDNKGLLLIFFAPQDVLRYIRNEGRQSLAS